MNPKYLAIALICLIILIPWSIVFHIVVFEAPGVFCDFISWVHVPLRSGDCVPVSEGFLVLELIKIVLEGIITATIIVCRLKLTKTINLQVLPDDFIFEFPDLGKV